MPDGTRLAARTFLPEDAEGDPVPGILEYIPYRKRDRVRLRDSIAGPYVAQHGYAYVRVDLRGSGDSEGVLLDEYLEQEMLDGLEVINWIAQQPWCSGSVGMVGISWGGFNALQLAARQPDPLGAIIAVCPSDDRYSDDVHYMGGCLLGDNLSWAAVMFAYNSCPPDPEIVGDAWRSMWLERLDCNEPWLRTWLRHQHRDAYWRHGSVSEDYDAIQVPVMAVSGWADGYSNTLFRLIEHLKVPRQALIGPWGHRYPHQGVPGPAIGFLQEEVRWWDQWLKGIDRGVERDPMLRAWMQDSVPPTSHYETRPGRWVGEHSWPSPDIEWRHFKLSAHHLVEEPETTTGHQLTIQSPLTVGQFAGKWCSYSWLPDLPHDQREEDGGELTFTSDPLPEDTEILGAPVLNLEFTASEPVAMVAVRLSDVAPDDKATRVTYSLLNLTHRTSHEHPSPLQPGERYTATIRLNEIAQVFPAGHRLRLSLSTSYWPLAWPPPNPVRLSVFPGSSTFDLPVRPPNPEIDQTIRFEDPDGAPVASTTLIEPKQHTWRVIRDLATDESTMEVTKDEGVYRIDEIDLTVTDRVWEWYTSQGDNFDSVRGEVYSVRGFARGDWSAEARSRIVLTSTPNEFLLHAELDAFEGTERIFSREWDDTIPRDLL